MDHPDQKLRTAPWISSPRVAGRTGRTVLAAVLVIVFAGSGLAQQPPKLADIRKTPFTMNTDRQAVEAWVQQQVEGLFTAEKPVIAGAVFYRVLTEDFSAADATAGFKDGLAEILAKAFVNRYEASTGSPGRASSIPTVFVLAALRVYERPTAFEGFQRALSDPTAGVRLLAAAGLASIREKIDDQQWAGLLANLQKAGIAETNPVVLERLYGLLRVQAAARMNTAITVVLAVLDARMTQFETKSGWPLPAEGQAATWLGEKAGGINDAQARIQATRQLARLLTDAVYAYTKQSPPKIHKIGLEEVVEKAEKALKAIARVILGGNPALPDVTKAMLQGGASQAENMQLALNEWVGTGQVAGVLNKPPFSFEPGLNIKRTAPETPAGPEAPATPEAAPAPSPTPSGG